MRIGWPLLFLMVASGVFAQDALDETAEWNAWCPAMEKAGIPHHYEIIPRGHKMTTVLTAWPKGLAFHAAVWK